MKKVILTTALCLLTMAFAVNSFAAIISYSAEFEQMNEPSNLMKGMVESDEYIRAFDEKQNFTLESDLFVDHLVTSGGIFTQESQLFSDYIDAGTKVHSHLIHFDPLSERKSLHGESIKFSEKILGLIVYERSIMSLTGSDYLGLDTTTFSTKPYRGIENWYSNPSDYFTISEDLTELLNVHLWVKDTMIDEIRVITAVPIPGAVWLLGSCIIGLIGIRRRVRR